MAYPQLFGPATREGTHLTSDGETLAWQVFGTKKGTLPPIACVNGLGCSTFFWHYLVRYFAPHTQVLIWDYRGHGDSSFPKDFSTLTVGTCADDLAGVLKSAGLDGPVALIGHSMGSQVILETYRRHPNQVAALMPLLGTYGKAIDTFFNTSLVSKVFPAVFQVVTRVPKTIQRLTKFAAGSPATLPVAGITGMVNYGMMRREDLDAYMENLAALDLRVFMHLARDMGVHTCEDILSTITAPTLVLAGEKDIYTPMHCSERMHHAIPNAELLVMPNGSHAALVEQPELLCLRVEKFLHERVKVGHPRHAKAGATA